MFSSMLIVFQSSASLLMWLSLLLFFACIATIPVSILLLKNVKGLFLALAQAAVPIVIGAGAFIKIYLEMADALQNIPASQRSVAKETGMEIARATLYFTGLETAVLLALAVLVFGIASAVRKSRKKA